MKILGICHDCLICSACVVVEGRVVSAMAEERLDRVKQSRSFPRRAIEACLEMAGLKMADIDEIAVAWNPALELQTIGGMTNGRRWRSEHLIQVPARLLQASGQEPSVAVSMQQLWPGCPPITYIDHHDSHLGNGYYLSPFEEAAVLILDGRGERQTGLMAQVKGTHIEYLQRLDFPHSLGLFYGAVTQHLGYRPDRDEWKVMAMASYAPEDNEYTAPMGQLLTATDDGFFELDLSFFEFYNFWDARMYSDKFVAAFGPPRRADEAIDLRHQKLAAAMQKTFEEAATQILEQLHRRTGLGQLVVSGGCFMNSVYNGKIAQLTPFEQVFISSCPDDSGTSIGSALWLHGHRTGERHLHQVTHNYWGRSYDDARCLEVAQQFKLPGVEVVQDPSLRAAQDLLEGKLLGWFQGPSEFGQRALGARSILADPRRAEAKEQVNAAVKYRESYRPFAPAILAEHVEQWFECEAGFTARFMEKVRPFRDEKKAQVPAVVHVDGSGRLQTVDADAQPRFRRLLQEFYAATGVPLLLNTSFNRNGEPIVETPEDAIRAFYSCGLDVLYLGAVRIAKA